MNAVNARETGDAAGAADALAPLREALKKDAFALYAQAIVSLPAQRTELAEVLVRLREEETSMLPPGEFLPLFEECGMLPQLDLWVVRHTLRALGKGLPVKRLSVNVSAQTLRDAAF